MTFKLLPSLIILCLLCSQAAAQNEPPPGPPPGGGGPMQMTDEELEADSFVGVTVDGKPVEGLFTIRQTGDDLTPLSNAASAFIDSLTDEQRDASLFPVESIEWRKWSNVDGYQRTGVSLNEMSEDQRDAAWTLLSEALSGQGLEEVRSIMHLNLVEGELLGETGRFNEDLYWFTFMGTPGDDVWGFQIDGHHLIINFLVAGDQFSITPAFMGSEPTIAPEGTTYAGEDALQVQQAAGLAFMKTLSDAQRAKAIIEPNKTGDDLVAGAFADNTEVAEEGLLAADLDETQKASLLELIETWTGNMREGSSDDWLADVKEHLDETWFAWIGGTGAEDVFYYRVFSPVILIEFDHEKPGPLGRNPDYASDAPTKTHIHAIVRTPNGNDYGKDWLRQHLAEDHATKD